MATTNHPSFWPRWEDNKPFALLLLILLTYGIVYLGTKIDRASKPEPTEHQITIEGQADTTTISDIATVTVGVESKADDVATAQANNSAIMNPLIEKIKALGIDATDIQTSNYNAYENTEWDGQTIISKGWAVSNQLDIKIRNTDLVQNVLDTAGQNGATSISGPAYALDDPNTVKEELRAVAIADAKTQAAKIANSLGLNLERVVGYSEWTDNGQNVFTAYSRTAVGGSSEAAPTVEPGSEKQTLHVSITFTLER